MWPCATEKERMSKMLWFVVFTHFDSGWYTCLWLNTLIWWNWLANRWGYTRWICEIDEFAMEIIEGGNLTLIFINDFHPKNSTPNNTQSFINWRIGTYIYVHILHIYRSNCDIHNGRIIFRVDDARKRHTLEKWIASIAKVKAIGKKKLENQTACMVGHHTQIKELYSKNSIIISCLHSQNHIRTTLVRTQLSN